MRVLEEDDLARLTIRGEADAEPFAVKVAVAEVIRNRMLKHYQSDGSVTGTVLAPGQFSCWWWKDPNLIRMARMEKDSHWDEAGAAWLEALKGSNTVKGALLYVNLKIDQPSWAKPEALLAEVGKLSFYRDGTLPQGS